MYYCYILKSLKDGSHYIGSTQDLKSVWKNTIKILKYSSTKAPFKLVWYSAFLTKKKYKF